MRFSPFRSVFFFSLLSVVNTEWAVHVPKTVKYTQTQNKRQIDMKQADSKCCLPIAHRIQNSAGVTIRMECSVVLLCVRVVCGFRLKPINNDRQNLHINGGSYVHKAHNHFVRISTTTAKCIDWIFKLVNNFKFI